MALRELRPVRNFSGHPFASCELCRYLGPEQNPFTGIKYDYYLFTSSSGDRSACAVHGNNDFEFGSSLLEFHVTSAWLMSQPSKDYLFGLVRSEYFSLIYLACHRLPLLSQE